MNFPRRKGIERLGGGKRGVVGSFKGKRRLRGGVSTIEVKYMEPLRVIAVMNSTVAACSQ